MTTWALLAPGPSASAEQAERVRGAGFRLGVVGNAYQLARWADFIAATDAAWWRRNLEAKALAGRKFTMHEVEDVEQIKVPTVGMCNSGVLALECAKNLGATRILLCGFDMHGTHFFGEYTNGLKNTTQQQRSQHLKQYATWAYAHRGIQVLNCTAGSALKTFPAARLEDETGIFEPAAHEAGQGGDVRPRIAA